MTFNVQLTGWFIKKFGHVNCMSLVMGAFGLRFLLYSLVTNPWMILPIELFQGLTYGIFYSTMASYAFIISPPGTGATVQSFVAASFEGIGMPKKSFTLNTILWLISLTPILNIIYRRKYWKFPCWSLL